MAGNPVPQMELPTALLAPTSRPSEPITSGIDRGDGVGSEAMGKLPNKAYTVTEIFRDLIPYDPSGDAELIYRRLVDEGY
jgi:hypothetical protein